MNMKKILLLISIAFIFTHFSIAGDKVDLKWRKFDEGVAEAKKTKKKILLDVYADWCKWCKKLDAEVYTDSKVASYLNKYYVLIKVNGESNDRLTHKNQRMTEEQLARVFGVTGFPTIIFLDSNAEIIDKLGGFVAADRFLPIIQYIGEDYYKKMKWDEFLEKKVGKK